MTDESDRYRETQTPEKSLIFLTRTPEGLWYQCNTKWEFDNWKGVKIIAEVIRHET